MTGIPRLQQREGLPPPYFPDDDAIRTQPHRRPHQTSDIDPIRGTKLKAVGGRALELHRVFQDHEPLGRAGEIHGFLEQRVRERRLAGARSAADQDVLAGSECLPEHFPAVRGEDPLLDIVVERVDPEGALSYGEDRPARDRRHHPLETAPVEGKLHLEDRPRLVDLRVRERRDGPQQVLCLGLAHLLANTRHPLPEALHPDLTVRIQQDLDHRRVEERPEHIGSQLTAELVAKAAVALLSEVDR